MELIRVRMKSWDIGKSPKSPRRSHDRHEEFRWNHSEPLVIGKSQDIPGGPRRSRELPGDVKRSSDVPGDDRNSQEILSLSGLTHSARSGHGCTSCASSISVVFPWYFFRESLEQFLFSSSENPNDAYHFLVILNDF